MRRYQQPPILLEKVMAYLMAQGKAGATRPQISAATGVSAASVNKCLVRWVPRAVIFAAGWDRHMHYFASKDYAEAHQARLPELREEWRKYQHERRKREQREYCRRVTAKKAALRPPKPPKAEKPKPVSIERAKNPFVIVKGRDVPVKVNAPSPANLRDAKVAVHNNVKVTVCPGWTHDPRYQVEPGRRVIGEFTTEWRQRRAA